MSRNFQMAFVLAFALGCAQEGSINGTDRTLPVPDAGPDGGFEVVRTEAAFLDVKCSCSAVAEGVDEAVCLAGGDSLPLRPNEQACVDAIVAGSEEARAWDECRSAAFGAATQCMNELGGCDTAGWRACNDSLQGALEACAPSANLQAQLDACVSHTIATVLNSLGEFGAARCACDPDPAACESVIVDTPDVQDCKTGGVQDALVQPLDTQLADSTRAALNCRGPLARRLAICLERVAACDTQAVEQCSVAYGLPIETDPGCVYQPVVAQAMLLCDEQSVCSALGLPPDCEVSE